MAELLHQRTWGSPGTEVLAFHGFGGSGEDFRPLAALTELRWSCPDLLGHGESPRPTAPEAHELDHQLESVAGLLQGRRILLGYSMGARLALHLALRSDQRARLDGLVLIGGSPGIQGEADRAKRASWDHDQATILEREGTETFMDRWSRLPMMESQRRHMTEASFQELRQRRDQGDALALAASLRGFGRGAMPDCWSALESLTVPTLLITGEQDERHRMIAQRMGDALPTSERFSIPTSGHAPHLENAVCLAPILNTWIAALP